jgi:hypothetical protein
LLAKIPKTVYDERVRKVFIFIACIFLLLILSSLWQNKTYAKACQIKQYILPSQEPTDSLSVKENFHGDVTIRTDPNCLMVTEGQLYVIAYKAPLADRYREMSGRGGPDSVIQTKPSSPESTGSRLPTCPD